MGNLAFSGHEIDYLVEMIRTNSQVRSELERLTGIPSDITIRHLKILRRMADREEFRKLGTAYLHRKSRLTPWEQGVLNAGIGWEPGNLGAADVAQQLHSIDDALRNQ